MLSLLKPIFDGNCCDCFQKLKFGLNLVEIISFLPVCLCFYSVSGDEMCNEAFLPLFNCLISSDSILHPVVIMLISLCRFYFQELKKFINVFWFIDFSQTTNRKLREFYSERFQSETIWNLPAAWKERLFCRVCFMFSLFPVPTQDLMRSRSDLWPLILLRMSLILIFSFLLSVCLFLGIPALLQF